MTGVYNFTDDKPPQPFIPIIAYWEDYDKVPWALPQVYDYMEGWDAVQKQSPITQEIYNRRHYLTCYGKSQKTSFGTIYIDSDGIPNSYDGNVIIGETTATLGDDSTATYKFNISQSGVYDVAVKICYPFWNKNAIDISLDGSSKSFSENRLWWPYWKSTCWFTLAKGKNLSVGQHIIELSGGVPGVQFYGFRVCSAFSESPSAGEAFFGLASRKFKDVNGVMAQPDRGFKLTTEVLRGKPDSALIWYEDFRDPITLQETYW